MFGDWTLCVFSVDDGQLPGRGRAQQEPRAWHGDQGGGGAGGGLQRSGDPPNTFQVSQLQLH